VTTPVAGALWTPAAALADLSVSVAYPAGVDGPRVEVVDRRLWVELISLPPREAAALASVLAEHARRGGWVDPHHPGE
jgi:hypothetical protein